MESELKVITTAKNKPCVLLKNYKYCFQIKNKDNTMNFRCSERKICTASLTMNSGLTAVLREPKGEKKHTCIPNSERNAIEFEMYSCKQKVAETLEPVQSLFDESLKKLEGMHSVNLPSFSSKKDALYAARKRSLGIELLQFKTFKDFILPKSISDNFLVYENKNEEIFIFCSECSRKTIKNTSRFIGDGTFKAVPVPFCQLYTFHAVINYESEINCSIVPVICVLLGNKLESTYVLLFEILNTLLGVNITHFKSDFELGAMNAVSFIYPSVIKSGCYLHYIKAIKRTAKEMGLCKDQAETNFIKLLMYLPLLPNERISEGWSDLLNKSGHVENLSEFKKYFEDYWMATITPNVFGCSEEKCRTDYHLEVWHNRLNRKLNRKPTVLKFFNTLKKEAKHYDIELVQANALKERKRSRKVDPKFDKHLQTLLMDLNGGDIQAYEFLNRASYLNYDGNFKTDALETDEASFTESENESENLEMVDASVYCEVTTNDSI